MHTNIDTLRRSVKRSVLLSPEIKTRLLGSLESFDEQTSNLLLALLDTEHAGIAELSARSIMTAAEKGDEEWLKELGTFFTKASKLLRMMGEKAERSGEEINLESYFDVVR